MVRLFIIASMLLLFVTATSGQTKEKKTLKFSVDRDYWEGCETGQGECKPLLFERNSKEDSVVLIMPCGGTFTTVNLTRAGQKDPIKTLSIGHKDCPPTFDLTGMADGEYGAYMLACGLGGPIKFTLRTK